MYRCSHDLLQQTYSKASLCRKDTRQRGCLNPETGAWRAWDISIQGDTPDLAGKGWAVLFSGWKRPTNFETISNLEFGPALSEGLARWPFQPKLFYDPMNPGKVSSKATFYFCASIFLPGISLAGLFCLVQDVSHCPPLSCPTRWRPWPDRQGAIPAVISLWKTKEFLSLCTAGVTNLNWSKQNNETQYYRCMHSFSPFVVVKYPVIYTHTKGWKMHQLWEQHGGTSKSMLGMKRIHSTKRQLGFRDCSMTSSVKVSWSRFGTFC